MRTGVLEVSSGTSSGYFGPSELFPCRPKGAGHPREQGWRRPGARALGSRGCCPLGLRSGHALAGWPPHTARGSLQG